MSDKYIKIKDNGLSGLALERVEAEDVAEELGVTDLKNAINNIETNTNSTFESGHWGVRSNSNKVYGVENQYKQRTKLDVEPDCTYRVTFCSYGTTYNVIMWADQFNIKISSVPGDASVTNKTIYVIAPANAKYLYVTHDISTQASVNPEIYKVSNCDYVDFADSNAAKLINYMGAGIHKTTAVDATVYNGYISTAGVVTPSTQESTKVKIYPVERNHTYKLYGRGAYINANVIASFSTSLYNGTDTLQTTILLDETPKTPTNYDITYSPELNGYIYIATNSDKPEITVYNTEYSSDVIDEINRNIVDADAQTEENTTDIIHINDILDITSEMGYNFSLDDLFYNLESTYIDDFTHRDSLSDEEHPYVLSGGTSVMPDITTGIGATRTGATGVAALNCTKTITEFPYYCLFGRISGARQYIKLYNNNYITIGEDGDVYYSGAIRGRIHKNAVFTVWYVTKNMVTIIDDAGTKVYLQVQYAADDDATISLVFGGTNGMVFGYASFVEFVKKPMSVLDFARLVEYNEIGEPSTNIKSQIRFAHSKDTQGGAVEDYYYVPDDPNNPSMELVQGLSNNPCVLCTLDRQEDGGYRTEIYITPIRGATGLIGEQGGLQRFIISADYYADSADNVASSEYFTYIFQLHDANFVLSGWNDAPPLSIRVKNGKLTASVSYIDNGAIPEGDNRHTTDDYDIGDFPMDKWIHLEIEAMIGWRKVLAPRLIIRINGEERLNIQTPIGFNIVSSGGSVNTHFGLYCPQWRSEGASYANMHREIKVTNIKWKGTTKVLL